MAITPRLELRQGQSLVMTPQLQQAIKLLQLSNVELVEYVEEALSENPMLERDESDESGLSGDTSDNGAESVSSTETGEADDTGDGDTVPDLEMATSDSLDTPQVEDLDADYLNEWGDEGNSPTSSELYGTAGQSASGGQLESTSSILEQTLSQGISLRDHLMAQINVDIDDPIDRMIAVHLTDGLDEAGRVTSNLDDVAEVLGCDVERVEAVLTRLQQLDPPGIFARDLVECWTIQLRERDRLDPAMQTLIDNVELLKQHDYVALSKLCHVEVDEIREMIAEIWSLNHRPAEAFDETTAQPITPDVLMRPGMGGVWIVELNNETLPRVLVNNSYYAEVSGAVRTKEEKSYITEKFHDANWLVKALHQRATTILKVAREIVRQQDAFFAKGVEYLKPLVLRDIAEEIEMHESTVSRVTSNKYIHTPRGIFELKYFFTQAIASSQGGAAHSAEAVRHRIKSLIDAEPHNAVLSDDKIVEILNGDGIDIARRTVAKYRESMKIPSSVQRRREKSRVS